MLRLILAAFAALAALASPAVAQSNQVLSSGAVLNSISTDEFVAFMAEGGLTAREVNRQPGIVTFELSIQGNPEAGVAYAALRSCDDSVAPARCALVQPFGFFNALGVTFQQVNEFNLNKSTIAMAMLGNDNRGILGTKSYFNGGITKLHFLTEMALFFADVDAIINAIRSGVLATIDYEGPGGGADNAQIEAALGLKFPRGVEFRVNNVGANAPPILPEAMKQYLAD